MLATLDPPDDLELTVPESRYSPSVRRRRLSRALRQLRETAGFSTVEEVAKRLDWSPGKLGGMEANRWKRPNPRDVKDLCELYGTDPETTADLMTLAREAKQRDWWEAQFGQMPESATYVGFEEEASSLHVYQPLVIPGLLQTPAYIRALARAALVRDPAEIEKRVELRTIRQQRMFEELPNVWMVIDEAALRRPFGTLEEQREQLQRLIDTDVIDRLNLQILPFAAGLHVGLSSGFVILTYEEDPAIVYIEAGTSALYLEKADDVESHSLKFQHLQAAALAPDASIRFMRDMISKLK
ncbi:helix-turn-helix transcriptional regulator [Actinocorallia lasiicapitis]